MDPITITAAALAAANGLGNSITRSRNAGRDRERDQVLYQWQKMLEDAVKRGKEQNVTADDWEKMWRQAADASEKMPDHYRGQVQTLLNDPRYRNPFKTTTDSTDPANKPPDMAALNQQIMNATNPANINSYYNTAAGNVNQRAATASALAGQRAASLAASRGLLNPNAAISAASAQASAPLYNSLADVEQARAGALNQNELNKYNMQYQLNRAGASDKDAADKLDILIKQYMLAQQRLAQEQRQFDASNNADWLDYLGLGAKVLSIPGIL